jgi:THO complex subunit 2
LYKWFSDEALYEQDNRTKAGGKIHYLPGFQLMWSPKFPVEKSALLTWHNFQQVLRKWHKKLFKVSLLVSTQCVQLISLPSTKKSLADCIQTNEFMHVYNAIIVLKEILPVFPLSAVIDLTGPPLNQVIETFIEKEERGDLKILARAYVVRQFPVGVSHLITNRPVIMPVSKSENISGLPQMCWPR